LKIVIVLLLILDNFVNFVHPDLNVNLPVRYLNVFPVNVTGILLVEKCVSQKLVFVIANIIQVEILVKDVLMDFMVML